MLGGIRKPARYEGRSTVPSPCWGPRASGRTITWTIFKRARSRPHRSSLRREPSKERVMRSNKFWIAGLIFAAPIVAGAQQFGLPAAGLPLAVQGVGIDQNLNAQVPLELTFKDETGQVVRLGQYFRQKPVVLALVYYECPGLGDLVLNGLTHTMGQISLNAGSDYEVVTVSFNPKESWQLAT